MRKEFKYRLTSEITPSNCKLDEDLTKPTYKFQENRKTKNKRNRNGSYRLQDYSQYRNNVINRETTTTITIDN